jgi:hypothetical protein
MKHKQNNYGYKYPCVEIIINVIINLHIMLAACIICHISFALAVNAEKTSEHRWYIKSLLPEYNDHFCEQSYAGHYM